MALAPMKVKARAMRAALNCMVDSCIDKQNRMDNECEKK